MLSWKALRAILELTESVVDSISTWPALPVGTNNSQMWEVGPTWPLAGHFLSPWIQGPLVIWITRMLLMSGELAKEQCWCRPSASIPNPPLPLLPYTGRFKGNLSKRVLCRTGTESTMYVKSTNGFRACEINKSLRQKWLSCNQYA